jgi:hypothetical protein
MRVPLHLQNDNSEEANLKRVQLHIFMAGLTGGRGFRQTSKCSAPTRIERIGENAFGK